jgi:alpha-galactosidase
MNSFHSEKIVLIGAGSAMFTIGIVSDLINAGLPVELALVDIDAQALAAAQKLTEKMIQARRAAIHLTATTDRRQALAGATVVIATIGVGGRRAWEQDVFIPRRYGIRMPVGDTVGPGGSSRALRMIPAMVAIARDVLELAPEALFFNYANPMSAVCYAVRKVTGAPMVGLCIGSIETAHYLARTLNADMKDITFNVAGINHLTWFSGVTLQGQDAMPRLRAHAQKVVAAAQQAVELARRGAADLPNSGSPFGSSFENPFSWQCLLWFEAFPAPMDRHITEFFPQLFRDGSYYGKTLGVDEFSFEETIALGDRIYEEMRADAFSPQALTEEYFARHGGEQEQAIEIIRAIRENQNKVFYANLPNSGQAPNLPRNAVIETPALTSGSGLHAIQQAPLPTAAAGVLATRFAWVEAVTEAALEGSRDKFIQALILDGGVQSPDIAARLADDLLAAQTDYLPQFSV